MLTERQEQILQGLLTEYIRVAEPISSRHLEGRYEFGVSPATIRNELLALSEQGYLTQLHTSSGRIPTDRGYRFLVDRLLKQERGVAPWFDQGAPWFSQGAQSQGEQDAPALRELARELALASSLFAAVAWRSMLWKEGWESLFVQPEFQDQQALLSFTRFVQDFERNIERFPLDSPLHVSIGRENRFSRVKDFSILVAVLEVPDKGLMTLALLGPKRMAYDKNIRLLSRLRVSLHGSR